jgi:outer membrane protein assembly factor BamB
MRRTLFLTVVPLLLAADWPQHLGPNRDGQSPETGLLRTWPKDGPGILWSREVGSGWAGVAVVGNRLILFHRVGDDEVVECLDPASGKPSWTAKYHTRYTDDFNFDNGPRATPLIADGRVFTFGADGDLRAWDLATGKGLWDHNVMKEYGVTKGFFGCASSPHLIAGRLLLNVGAKGAGVVAFDPVTGKELWKAADDPVSYSSPVSAKIGGEELAVFFTRSGLLAVSPERGEVRYSYPFRPRAQASVSAASPVVAGDRVFLSTAYGTGATLLDLKKGKVGEVWRGDDILSCHYNTPLLIKGHLYGIDGRQEGGQAALRCVEWETGKDRWTKATFGCAGLVAADGLVIACPENGDLVLIEPSPDGYKELARAVVLERPVRTLPALAAGRLFVRDGKRLVALEVGKK